MVVLLSLTTLLLGLGLQSHAGLYPRQDNVIDFTSPPPDLAMLPNNSLFWHWRPKAHIQAGNGWMNDPQAMWISNTSPRFHVGYQAHPQHLNWGNISMGAAVSEDLVRWTDLGKGRDDARTLGPSEEYDRLGVFDGTIIPLSNGSYLQLYTSVRTLPTSWRAPGPRDLESQSLARTDDGGRTWVKYANNPVLPLPPDGFNITGWRDPFLFKSFVLRNLTRNDTSSSSLENPYFLTISGGEFPAIGPRLFLYRQNGTDEEDLTQWQFLGPVFSQSGNISFSEWSGNWGFNFEVANVVELNEEGDIGESEDGGDGVHFLMVGTEGGRDGHQSHWPLWIAGNYVRTENGSAMLEHTFAGVVDWGETYAWLSVLDSTTTPHRRVLFGWVYEDDNGYGLLAKGWQGTLALPRRLFVKTVRNVVSPPELVNEAGSWGVRTEQSDNSTTIYTLGTMRVEEIRDAFRNENQRSWVEPGRSIAISDNTSLFIPFEQQPTSKHYELTAQISFPINSTSSLSAAGFSILRSTDGQEATNIFYQLSNESIIVDRSQSSLVTQFNHDPDSGKLRLWNVSSTAQSTDAERELLNLVIVVDNSVVEIYANDEFSLVTRVYPWLDSSFQLGFYLPPGAQGNVTFSDVRVWEGLVDAWPERPDNYTPPPLVWDGPEITNNGTYWPGW